ncbi:hypothetical protein Daesc_001339 [Daldinia eschscholtzii]|uniref:Isochorismatase-like domain-containing protein n=1 Tax=Daldinia eschscholtzii TaxID=292717 RepID=A0AAX6MTX1_9PEZI
MASGQHSTDDNINFGKNYVVLNLDLMTVLIDVVKDTEEGRAFISGRARWNDAVHKMSSRPPVIFIALFFNPGEPELAQDAPSGKLIRDFGSFAAGSSAVQIAPCFKVDCEDIVLQKTRWYAGAGNSLGQNLKARDIDTVIIRLRYNVLELPLEQHQEYSQVMLRSLLPKMNLRVISIDEALKEVE